MDVLDESAERLIQAGKPHAHVLAEVTGRRAFMMWSSRLVNSCPVFRVSMKRLIDLPPFLLHPADENRGLKKGRETLAPSTV